MYAEAVHNRADVGDARYNREHRMSRTRSIEYIFFFGILIATAYLLWRVIAPFFSALVIATIVVTVGYPFYRRVLAITPWHNRSIAAFLTTIIAVLLVLTPLTVLGYLVFAEALALYTALNEGGSPALDRSVASIERAIQVVSPTFSVDLAGHAQQVTGWITSRLGSIFAGTLSTFLLALLSLFGIFYFFRDGEQFIRAIIHASPLPDDEDAHILKKLGSSVRSVVLGTLTIAVIQGTLVAIAFEVIGINGAVLWGAVAALGALIPGVGTSIVLVPAIVFLALDGAYGAAIGLAVWGVFAVSTIDNILGPYLMSRGVRLHPFFVLLTVLGGIALFGPLGLVLGPVALSLFIVLFELYRSHMQNPGFEDT